MRLAIMQPYFLPYLGYFQLMASVDRFIFLDDVNYIKRGWIGRNRILSNEIAAWLSISLDAASQNKLILDIQLLKDSKWRDDLCRRVNGAYCKAPFFEPTFELFSSILANPESNLSRFLILNHERFRNLFGMSTKLDVASVVAPRQKLKGTERILDICVKQGASCYVNLPGGRELYDPAAFAERDIALKFIEPQLDPYPQNCEEFVPGLSILDVLMWNSVATVSEMVRGGHLVEA